MTLEELNNQYTNNYQALIETQIDLQGKLSNYKFDLSKREMTDAIIHRMGMNWWYAETMNKLLERKKKPSSADYFTETCLYFLKAYFKSEGDLYQVKSEYSVNKIKSRNAVKPDISIWKGDILVGVIELKTLNDWFRNTWRTDFENRENQIKQVSGNPDLFFAVVAFWNFFDFEDPNFNVKYFGLKNRENNTPIDSTIEKLINAFLTSQK